MQTLKYQTIENYKNPVHDFIKTLSKGFTPFSTTVRLSCKPQVLKVAGDQLIIGLKNGEVIIYSIKNKLIAKRFSASNNSLTSLVVDEVQKEIITSSRGTMIDYWSYEGKLLRSIQSDHQGIITNLLFIASILYIADSEGFITKNDTKALVKIKAHDSKISCLEFKQSLATGGHDCKIVILSSDLEVKGILQSKNAVHRVCFVNERRLISAGIRSLFYVWDLVHYVLEFEMQGEDNWIRSIASINSVNYVVAGTSDSCVRYWNLGAAKDEAYESFLAHDSAVTHICTNYTGSLIITGSLDRTVKIWQTCLDKKQDKLLKGHSGNVTCLLLTYDDSFLYSGSADSAIKKWSIKTLNEVNSLKDHEGAVICMSFFGDLLLSVGEDRYLIAWSNDVMFKKFHFGEAFLCMCTNMSHVFLGTRSGKILVLDNRLVRTQILEGHLGAVSSIVLDSQNLYSASYDKCIKIWNIETLKEPCSFKAHNGAVTKLCVLPEENRIVSIGRDKLLKHWFLTDPPLDIVLKGHKNRIVSLTLNSNGWYIFTGDKSGKLICWCNEELIPLSEVQFPDLITDVTCLKTSPVIVIASGKDIFLRSDALADNHLMTVPNFNSYLYFLYLSELLKGKYIPFKHMFKDYIVMPLRINLLHILAYVNDCSLLKEALKNNVVFMSSDGENPLRIALQQGAYQSVDAILKYIPIYQQTTSPYIFKIIENEIIELLSINLKHLPELLRAAFPVVKGSKLPKFGNFAWRVRMIKSEKINLLPEKFGIEAGSKDAIEFRSCIFRLPLELGSKECIRMLENLINCKNPDVFNQMLIQHFLDYLFCCAYPVMILLCLLHFLSSLILFLYFLCFQNSLFFGIFILLVSVFFLVAEMIQLVQSLQYYFSDFWNIIDFFRVFSSVCTVAAILSNFNEDTIKSLMSFSMLFSMIRLISIFRIFQGTRYMMRLIFEVVYDVSSFLLLLMISTLTMTVAFYFAYGKSIAGTDIFLLTYLINFGEMPSDCYHSDYYIKSLFLFVLFLNPLVMMNLLIATMGSTFERIQSTVVISNYKEITSLVLEVSTFMFWKRNDNNKAYLQSCLKKEQSISSQTLGIKVRKFKIDIKRLDQLNRENSEKIKQILSTINR